MRRSRPWWTAVLTAFCLVGGIGLTLLPVSCDGPVVIAHRGASAYLPEHTLAGYALAVKMGADFIEPDLYLTSDGVLVNRHDRNLDATTNGGAVNVDSLTFAQLRKLDACSRGDRVGTPGYAKIGNGYYTTADRFKVASFAEVLDYVYGLYQKNGQIVGVYPEAKTIGTDDVYNVAVADAMIDALADAKYDGFFNGQHGNVYLQSFSQTVARHLSKAEYNPFGLPVVYLVDNCPTAAANAYAIAGFADGVGTGIFDMNAGHVNALHHAGLFVDAYTLSTDALLGRGSYETVLGYGVDGIITNNPNLGVAAVAALDPVHRTGQALFCAGLIGLIGLVSWAWRRRAAGVSILWQRTDFAA